MDKVVQFVPRLRFRGGDSPAVLGGATDSGDGKLATLKSSTTVASKGL